MTKKLFAFSLLLFTFSLLLFTSVVQAAEITMELAEEQVFAYALDDGELMKTDTVGPARVKFAANRNATYTFYGVAEDGTASLLSEPLVVTDVGETVDNDDSYMVAVDTRKVKAITSSAGSVTVDLTYSGDNWGETVGGSATIAAAFEGGEAKPLATGLTGEGTVSWKPESYGVYDLTHTADGITETAIFKFRRSPGIILTFE